VSGFTDWTEVGIFPLQDHADAEHPLGMRMQIVGGRLKNLKDPSDNDDPNESLAEYGKENGLGTLGDIHPWLFWQTGSREQRDTGSWAQSFAAIWGDGNNGGSPTTGPDGDVMAQPVRNSDWSTDLRFAGLTPGWPKGFGKLGKGHMVAVFPAMEERSQHPIMGSIDPRIFCPSAGGSSEAGTIVVDFQPDNEPCMDGIESIGIGGRHSPIQSVLRVVAMPPQGGGHVETAGNCIAINYATSRGGFAGYGMVWSRLDTSVSGPTTGGPDNNGPTTGGHPPDPITPGGSVSQAVQSLKLKAAPGAPPIQTSRSVDSAEGDTGDEDIGKTPDQYGHFNPTAVGGHGSALMAHLGGYGPLCAGSASDKHRMGTDRDGNPINAGHISADAYIYDDSERDGPFHFEGDYPKPSNYPLQAKVHLTWDKREEHAFADGSRKGKWKWYAEVPYVAPDGPPGDIPFVTLPPVAPPISGPTTGGPPNPGGGGAPTPQGGPTGGGIPGAPVPSGGSPTGGGGGGGGGGAVTGGPSGPASGGAGGGGGGGGQPGGPTTGGYIPGLQPSPWYPAVTGSPFPGEQRGTPGSGGSGGGGGKPPGRNPPDPTTPGGSPGGSGNGNGPTGGGGGRPPWEPDPSDDIGWEERYKRWKQREKERYPDPKNGSPYGSLTFVGETDQSDNGAYSILHPLQEAFAAIAFRPQNWSTGSLNFEHNPNESSDTYANDERTRPQVLVARAYGGLTVDGAWDYKQTPETSRARGGIVNGGLLLGPPQFEMEDYIGNGSGTTESPGVGGGTPVDQPGSQGYLTLAPGACLAFGIPNSSGSLCSGSAAVMQNGLSGPMVISQLNSSGSPQSLMSLQQSPISAERMVAVSGTQALRIPRGTNAQRPTVLGPTGGEIRINSDGANDVFEYWDQQGMAWVSLGSGGGGGGLADGDYGDVVVSGSGTAIAIDANAVTDSKLRQSAGLSVVARSANSTGNVADVTAGTDGHVLRRSGTTLAFGTVATAGIGDDQVTNAKAANMSAATIKGRASGAGTGDPTDLSGSQVATIVSPYLAIPTMASEITVDPSTWSGLFAGLHVSTVQDVFDWIDANVTP